MAIVQTDIQFRLSGGAGNAVPNASLGGVKSATEMVAATLENLFDIVPGAEYIAGNIEYRCFYAHNNHGTLALQNAEVFVTTNTPSDDTLAEIGLGTSGINGVEQTVADESTAPAGVAFSSADGEENALAIGNIPAGQHMAIWVRRTVAPGNTPLNLDNVLIRVQGDTAE